jgi:hypothetical protein
MVNLLAAEKNGKKLLLRCRQLKKIGVRIDPFPILVYAL